MLTVTSPLHQSGPADAHGLALPPLDRTYYVVTTLFLLATLAIALAVDDSKRGAEFRTLYWLGAARLL